MTFASWTFLKYLVCWHVYTFILAHVIYGLSGWDYWLVTEITTLIGAILFYNVDRYILCKK